MLRILSLSASVLMRLLVSSSFTSTISEDIGLVHIENKMMMMMEKNRGKLKNRKFDYNKKFVLYCLMFC